MIFRNRKYASCCSLRLALTCTMIIYILCGFIFIHLLSFAILKKKNKKIKPILISKELLHRKIYNTD